MSWCSFWLISKLAFNEQPLVVLQEASKTTYFDFSSRRWFFHHTVVRCRVGKLAITRRFIDRFHMFQALVLLQALSVFLSQGRVTPEPLLVVVLAIKCDQTWFAKRWCMFLKWKRDNVFSIVTSLMSIDEDWFTESFSFCDRLDIRYWIKLSNLL